MQYAQTGIHTIRIMLPFCFGYMVSYFSRNITAIISDDLSMDFAINASSLGLLTSAYFLAFALCQLPLGLLLDRFRPERVEAAFLCVATVGAVLSATANDTFMLSLGRILMGFGVSGCLMAAYRAIILRFPVRQVPLLNGVVLAFGSLGAIISGWPPTADFALEFGWRNIFYGLSVAFFIGIVLLLTVIPKQQPFDTKTREPENQTPQHSLIGGMTHVLLSRPFWIIMPAAALTQGLMLAINGLWAVPWLMRIEGFTLHQTSILLVLIYTAMMAGQVLAGWFGSIQGGHYRSLLQFMILGMFIAQTALMLIGTLSGLPTTMLWVCFIFFSPFSMLAYPMLTQRYPPELSGRVIALLNFMVFVAAFLFQWLIGEIIGAIPANSVEVDVVRFQIGFVVPTIITLIAVIWLVIGDQIERDRNAYKISL